MSLYLEDGLISHEEIVEKPPYYGGCSKTLRCKALMIRQAHHDTRNRIEASPELAEGLSVSVCRATQQMRVFQQPHMEVSWN